MWLPEQQDSWRTRLEPVAAGLLCVKACRSVAVCPATTPENSLMAALLKATLHVAFLCGPANDGLRMCRAAPYVRAAVPEVGLG
ncbi:hypothetical protein QQF64_004662 [Cirrhinus molitorella]|uniref:Uncharacterized protein n=1 Tax=Cirrhinus molitorella TaxID=172907 RepID=A0ABR3MGV9_9TELE